MRILITSAIAALVGIAVATQPSAQEQPRQNDQVVIRIDAGPGRQPRYAVPDFIPLSNDPEIVAAAKTIGEVLWADLNFEREFYLIPRDTYKTIPPATSIDQSPWAASAIPSPVNSSVSAARYAPRARSS